MELGGLMPHSQGLSIIPILNGIIPIARIGTLQKKYFLGAIH